MHSSAHVKSEQGAVRSADGTSIGYVKMGSGPSVVLVHGALCIHEDWLGVARALADRFTCYVMDRRGRGLSGDAADYCIEREVEDITAVLAAAGPDACLFGHSFGGFCALLTAEAHPVARLVVYEPPWPLHGPEQRAERGGLARCPDLIARGACEDALVIFLSEVLGTPRIVLRCFKTLPLWLKTAVVPLWPRMIRLMPVTVREMAAVESVGAGLERFAALETPVCLLLGSQTRQPRLRDPTLRLAQQLPHAEVSALSGHGHMAQMAAPRLVAERIAAFLSR